MDLINTQIWPLWVALCLFFKTSLCANLSYDNEFDLHGNEPVGGGHISYEWFPTKTHFEIEAKDNSEMAYWFQVSKDAELCQAPEKLAARRRTVVDSESVYDLLTVALVRRAQYGMLAEVCTCFSKFN